MNPKVLLPVLIALHLAAMALIVEGLNVDEGQSDDDDRARQVVEWNPACVAGHASEAIVRYRSSEYRQPNAIVADQPSCVIFAEWGSAEIELAASAPVPKPAVR